MASFRRLLALALVGSLVACGGSGGAPPVAPTVEVTNLAAAGAGSLRDALDTAVPGTTITFAAGLAGTIDLSTGGLTIDRPVTILGPASGGVTLSGGGTARVLEVTASGSAAISDLTVTAGDAGSGGGIHNAGVITLTRVVVSSCTTAAYGRGGGLQNEGGVATCRDCTITGCAAYNGGGFANDEGILTLRGCTVHANWTTGNSGAGGVNSDGTLVCVNCTFSDNHTDPASGVGGGLGVFADMVGTQTALLSCTVTGCSASGAGGGIYAQGELGPPLAPTILRIENTIVAANNSGSGGPDLDLVDPEVTVAVAARNVVGIGTNSTLVDGVSGNQVGTPATPLDPLLGALTDNGGETLTHLPGAVSVALDVVPMANCLDELGAPLTTDQCGNPRPAGPMADAGSVERP